MQQIYIPTIKTIRKRKRTQNNSTKQALSNKHKPTTTVNKLNKTSESSAEIHTEWLKRIENTAVAVQSAMSGAKEELRKRQSAVRAACSAEESLTEVGETANHTRVLQVQVHQRDYRVNNPAKDCGMRRRLPMQLSSLIFASISPCLPIFLSNKAFHTAAASYIPSCHSCIAQILAAMIYHHEHQNLDENCDAEMMLHCFLPQHNKWN